MVKDTNELIINLNQLKDEIINSVNMGGSDVNRSLSQKLLELSSKDSENAELYQLISLLNSNIDTEHIKFKKKSIEVINKLITIKINSLQMMKEISDNIEGINVKTDIINKKISRESSGMKIPYIGLIKVKDVLLFIIITFLILFLAYEKDPIATGKTLNSINYMKEISIKNLKAENHEKN